MYPDAEIRTRSVDGRPVVLAVEESQEGGDLIRLIRFDDLDANRADTA